MKGLVMSVDSSYFRLVLGYCKVIDQITGYTLITKPWRSNSESN